MRDAGTLGVTPTPRAVSVPREPPPSLQPIWLSPASGAGSRGTPGPGGPEQCEGRGFPDSRVTSGHRPTASVPWGVGVPDWNVVRASLAPTQWDQVSTDTPGARPPPTLFPIGSPRASHAPSERVLGQGGQGRPGGGTQAGVAAGRVERLGSLRRSGDTRVLWVPAAPEPPPLCPVPEVLQLCDALRDDVLPELGVRLEDHEGASAWRFLAAPGEECSPPGAARWGGVLAAGGGGPGVGSQAAAFILGRGVPEQSWLSGRVPPTFTSQGPRWRPLLQPDGHGSHRATSRLFLGPVVARRQPVSQAHGGQRGAQLVFWPWKGNGQVLKIQMMRLTG